MPVRTLLGAWCARTLKTLAVGCSGNWTRDFPHPKREACPCTSQPLAMAGCVAERACKHARVAPASCAAAASFAQLVGHALRKRMVMGLIVVCVVLATGLFSLVGKAPVLLLK